MSPIIDIYTHIFPERFFQEMDRAAPNLGNIGKRLRGITKLFDLDARFKEMDQYGDYRQIISLPNPAIEDIATPQIGMTLARIVDGLRADQAADQFGPEGRFMRSKSHGKGLSFLIFELIRF